MNTQNTPIHVHLWHRDFWLLAVSNLLITMSAYLLIPVMPAWMVQMENLTARQAGLAMGAFGVGVFLFGAFTSFLVEHFRRNVVCIWAILLMASCLFFFYYLDRCRLAASFPLVLGARLLLGAFFGAAQMVLSSTLIIDTCESFHRTEANHSASWFARFALSLGPLGGILIGAYAGFGVVLLSAVGCAVAAVVLILLIHFPFRTPQDDVRLVSLDRFFLPQGWPLFLNLLLVSVVAGLVLSLPLTERFYAMMMSGFLLAILAQRYVFRDAELKSEVVSGLILICAALLMMLTRQQHVVGFASPLFIGFSLGIIGSRFLLFFIKLSRHCQRGTSQSSYTLGWESGLAVGLAVGIGALGQDQELILKAALVMTVAALVMYIFFVHQWFLSHKNR